MIAKSKGLQHRTEEKQTRIHCSSAQGRSAYLSNDLNAQDDRKTHCRWQQKRKLHVLKGLSRQLPHEILLKMRYLANANAN